VDFPVAVNIPGVVTEELSHVVELVAVEELPPVVESPLAEEFVPVGKFLLAEELPLARGLPLAEELPLAGGLLIAEEPPPGVESLPAEELPPVVELSLLVGFSESAVVDIPGAVYIPDVGYILGMVDLPGMAGIQYVVDPSTAMGLSAPTV